ncbi:hypothetical protein NPIL_89341 [Nephila pilipes]|uniref:Uncharacterized protein n=1 Tax=Nephila pilipes TaxID=299642 RepID=A0A8X6N1A3_NEPPI|nr:hypothetical protein NPIL_89341 [Nephila pilipes]
MMLSGIAQRRHLHSFIDISTAPIPECGFLRPHSKSTNHFHIFNKIHRSSIPELTSPSFCDVTTVTSHTILGHSLGNIGMACCLPTFNKATRKNF